MNLTCPGCRGPIVPCIPSDKSRIDPGEIGICYKCHKLSAFAGVVPGVRDVWIMLSEQEYVDLVMDPARWDPVSDCINHIKEFQEKMGSVFNTKPRGSMHIIIKKPDGDGTQ